MVSEIEYDQVVNNSLPTSTCLSYDPWQKMFLMVFKTEGARILMTVAYDLHHCPT